jgi:hypothetical protein
MADPIQQNAREARLAAKLRENLRRRKSQAKTIDAASATPEPGALPKAPPKS